MVKSIFGDILVILARRFERRIPSCSQAFDRRVEWKELLKIFTSSAKNENNFVRHATL